MSERSTPHLNFTNFPKPMPRLLGRLFDRVDLIKPVSNVLPSVLAYVGLGLRSSAKSFFDFNEIWRVCRPSGRLVMHDGMQYDPIQGQGLPS